MKKFLKILLILVLVIFVAVSVAVTYVKTALPNVGPAPRLNVKLSAENIARGKYLVSSVVLCMDCHSARDWSKLTAPVYSDSIGAGGMKFGHEFGLPGNFYAPNLTPYNLSKYTDGELFRIITTGETREGKPLFPIMPYLTYGTLDKEDIYAIIAYLRTLPPIEKDAPKSEPDFPLNIIEHTIPQKAAFTKRPAATDSIAYGKYMVAMGSCADCHTTQDDKGNPLPGYGFAGGTPFKMPTGGTVRTANITPDNETGIGKWTKAQFFAAIHKYKGVSPLPAVSHNDFNSIMPYATFSRMTDQDLSAIYAYLRTVKPVKHSVVKFESGE